LNGNVSGETRSDIIIGQGELGRWLRVAVTASNVGGESAPAYSDWLGPVEEALPEPATGRFLSRRLARRPSKRPPTMRFARSI
jgi:hypothetical protein